MFGDVRKIAFRRLCYFGCVLACCLAYLMLYLFGDIPNTYTYVFRVVTSGYDFTQDPQGALEGGPQLGAQHCQAVASDCLERWSIDQTTSHQWVALMDPCCLKVEDLQKKPTKPIDGAWSHPRTVDVRASMVLKNLPAFFQDLGGFGKFTPSLIKLEDGYFRCL